MSISPKHGWLGRGPREGDVLGVKFDASLPTRNEEYQLLADTLEGVSPGSALDLATGYVPNWHVAPYILSVLGWNTLAVDVNSDHLLMPPDSRVSREMADITSMPQIESKFDLIICISVLEHLGWIERQKVASEIIRLSRPGTILIVTADDYPPELFTLLFASHFKVGSREPDPSEDRRLNPSVSYIVGERV